jgi:hypothetical protein
VNHRLGYWNIPVVTALGTLIGIGLYVPAYGWGVILAVIPAYICVLAGTVFLFWPSCRIFGRGRLVDLAGIALLGGAVGVAASFADDGPSSGGAGIVITPVSGLVFGVATGFVGWWMMRKEHRTND